MSTMTASKHDFLIDKIIWIAVMIFLSSIAFYLLARDSQKKYGAVSFGVFPEFSAVDNKSEIFTQRKLHGQLSAVIWEEQLSDVNVLNYLNRLATTTAHGRKYLHTIVLSRQANAFSYPSFQALTLNTDQYKNLSVWYGENFPGKIILIDQNRVIRGAFDLNDKLERLNFEGAVRGIL